MHIFGAQAGILSRLNRAQRVCVYKIVFKKITGELASILLHSASATQADQF